MLENQKPQNQPSDEIYSWHANVPDNEGKLKSDLLPSDFKTATIKTHLQTCSMFSTIAERTRVSNRMGVRAESWLEENPGDRAPEAGCPGRP